MEAKTLDVLQHGRRRSTSSPARWQPQRRTADDRSASRRPACSLILILAIFLGFPVAFTLMALGVGFGYYAYYDADRMWRAYDRAVERRRRLLDHGRDLGRRLLQQPHLRPLRQPDLLGHVERRADGDPALPVHGLHRRARQHRRPAVHARCTSPRAACPARSAVAALITCTLFATATGIVGAVVTLMGLLAFPAMLKARYDVSFAAGVICAGGTLGILIPPSIMLIVYAATSGVSVVRLYAGALLPGFLLAGLYLVYVVGRAHAAARSSRRSRPRRRSATTSSLADLSGCCSPRSCRWRSSSWRCSARSCSASRRRRKRRRSARSAASCSPPPTGR